jgi:catechol 2,3-dioxygenase-like lactoylglutathione lyase family enzyme
VEVKVEPDQEYYPMPAFPTLLASSLEASRRFYVEGLGFQHVFSIPGPDGKPVVEHIRFARYADILLEQEAPGSELKTGPRGRGVRLTFSLPLAERSAQEIVDRARSWGATVEGPVERPWNTRDVVVSDPDGYVLVFTEPLDLGKTMDQVLDDIGRGAQHVTDSRF